MEMIKRQKASLPRWHRDQKRREQYNNTKEILMLYIVHSVDTEGPLNETLDATFQRLEAIYGVRLESSEDVLKKLQRGEIDVGNAAKRDAIMTTFAPQHLNYMRNWQQLKQMLDRWDSTEVRNRILDSAGNGWLTNWHCLGSLGFDPSHNPRERPMGPHDVFDFYRARYYEDETSPQDSIHWHFHPLPITRQITDCATAYFTNDAIHELISRRILERAWFPCVNRPGFHTERPDSHWFLEQWMPFDIANNNYESENNQPDLAGGRFGDWRRAPSEWTVYHPHHDDYQLPGNCRRAIARVLYMGGRFACLTQEEINRAFLQARDHRTIMAITNHDFRDMIKELGDVQEMLARAREKFPDVEFRFMDATEAFRSVLNLSAEPHAEIKLVVERLNNNAAVLTINTDTKPFGPQPWFCYRTKSGEIVYDNLDQGSHPLEWTYTFDEQNTLPTDIDQIGVAFNTATGRTSVLTADGEGRNTSLQTHN